jgi:nucleoside-diphosphate-sugar epimerase/spore maturation protein CgeB
MKPPRLDILFIGLSLSSSWGNGHATTYRSLLKGLARRGHRVVFLERNRPWYAENRDLTAPDFCELRYYDDVRQLRDDRAGVLARADAIVIGSYVPDGVAVIDAVKRRSTGQLCFYDIDTPVTLAKLAAGDHEYIAARQVPLFDIYLSFTGGPTLERLRRQYGARRTEALYCSVDVGAYRATKETPRWDLGYLGTYSADRQPALERLLLDVARRLPRRRFVVAGPLYPEGIDWPDNVDRIDHLAPTQHASFYARQRFTLNITRADMKAAGWSPSVRLFEAAACGTPIVSDTWPGLGHFFPEGVAIRTVGATADVLDALRLDERARSALAVAARKRVVSQHSGLARAVQLERYLQPASPRAASVMLRRIDRADRVKEHSRGKAMLRTKVTPRRKTVLVAGGAGFLGLHLVETLIEQGDRVFCVDNFLTGSFENIAALRQHPNFRLFERDVCQPLPIRDRIDEIYNLACVASPPRYQAAPVHTMLTCVNGTLNLLELAERNGARFLQASTSEVYGDPLEHPQREEYLGNVNCTGPRACYDEGKRAAETLCFDFLRAGRVDARVSRIFNTYGPRMQRDDGRIVSNLIVQALRDKPLTIYGDGSQTRSFCYVSDLVRGLTSLMAVEPNPDGPVNLGNPGEFTINELAALVKEETRTRSEPHYLPLPVDDPRRRRPDITRAAGLLGWAPTVSLEEGLRLTIAWFMKQEAARENRPRVRSGKTVFADGARMKPER